MSHWKVTEDYFEHPSMESNTAFIVSMFNIKGNLLKTYFNGHTKNCSSISLEGRNISKKFSRICGRELFGTKLRWVSWSQDWKNNRIA